MVSSRSAPFSHRDPAPAPPPHLTDLQLPLNAALAALAVVRLGGVVFGHHLHKLPGQRGVLGTQMGVQVSGSAPQGPRAPGARAARPRGPAHTCVFRILRSAEEWFRPSSCSMLCSMPGQQTAADNLPYSPLLPPTPTPRVWLSAPRPPPHHGELVLSGEWGHTGSRGRGLGTDGGGANKGPSRHDAFQAYMHTKLCACMHLLRARPGGSGPLCLSPAQEGCAPNKGPCPRWAGAGGRPPPAGHMTPRPWILGLLHGTRQCWPLFNSL